MDIKLRDYQERAVEKALWAMSLAGNDIIQIGTGGGKSLVVAELARRLERPILILQPSVEILQQNKEKLSLYVPQKEIGVYSAAANRKDISKYTFATIQSIYKKPKEFTDFGIFIIDECFIAGTKIDGRRIEDIEKGDYVRSFNHETGQIEYRKVEAVSKRLAPMELICVDLGCAVIITTRNHPIYVLNKGYVKAEDLQSDDEVIYEKNITQKPLLKTDSANLFAVWGSNTGNDPVPTMEIQKRGQGISQANLRLQSEFESLVRANEEQQSDVKNGIARKNGGDIKKNRTQAKDSGWKRSRINRTATTLINRAWEWLGVRIYRKNKAVANKRVSISLQDRFSESELNDSDRNRRSKSLQQEQTGSGSEKDRTSKIVRVASVKILERGSDGKYSNGSFYHYVYNLEVEGNHNYFANGVLVHNCHAVNPKNLSGMFTSFIETVSNMRQAKVKCFGLTATPYRNVTGYHQVQNEFSGQDELEASLTLKLLTRMRPLFWNRLLFNVNNGELVKRGYLCSLKYVSHDLYLQEELKTNKTKSDFDLDDVEKKTQVKHSVVIDAIRQAEREFKSVLVFCTSIHQAQELARQVPGSQFVTGKTEKKRREWIISEFKKGRIKTVFNMGVLTTGFDHPELDCIVLLRPTRSLSLWYQMAGRGSRIAPGKTHCTLIDFTNTVKRLGTIESIELRKDKSTNEKWELFTDADLLSWHNRSLYSYRAPAKKAKQVDYEEMPPRLGDNDLIW